MFTFIYLFFLISGLLWPISPEGQTHTCLTHQPFSSQWGSSWESLAAPLQWVQSQESSLLSYPLSETTFEMKIPEMECNSTITGTCCDCIFPFSANLNFCSTTFWRQMYFYFSYCYSGSASEQHILFSFI